MRKITYGGGAFFTGDAIAAALMQYAAALARAGTAATTVVPVRTLGGVAGEVEVLLGPSSELTSESAPYAGDEIVDDPVVERLRAMTAGLGTHLPAFELPFQDDGPDASGESPHATP